MLVHKMTNPRRHHAARCTLATHPHVLAANSQPARSTTSFRTSTHHLADTQLMTVARTPHTVPASTLPNNKVPWPMLLSPTLALPQPAQSCSSAWHSAVSSLAALARHLQFATTTGAAPPTAGSDQPPGKFPRYRVSTPISRKNRKTPRIRPDSTRTPRPLRSSN